MTLAEATTRPAGFYDSIHSGEADMLSPPVLDQCGARLSDLPDWRYLLREYYEFYRSLSAGGSPVIRSHQRAVRIAINGLIKSNPPVECLPPATLPVTAHLRRALDNGREERHAAVVRAIAAVKESLSWQIGYEKPPRGLERKFAFAEFAGPSGPIITDRVILGIVLFAPGCTYPAHAHKHISESYICLSGAVSENHQGVYGPGSLIFNPPGHTHRITVSDWEPALLAYAWAGPPEELANYRLQFSRKSKGGT